MRAARNQSPRARSLRRAPRRRVPRRLTRRVPRNLVVPSRSDAGCIRRAQGGELNEALRLPRAACRQPPPLVSLCRRTAARVVVAVL